MIKTRWVRNVAVFGTAATLSLASYAVTGEKASATGFCQETQMAGLSLSLDKYYTDNIQNAEENTTAIDESQAVAADETAVPAPTATPAAENTDTKDNEKKEESNAPKIKKQFQTMGVSIAGDYVNVRKKANTDSKVKGKLYKGSSAEILGEKNGWYKISSGNVIGYVKKEFLATKENAQNLSNKYGTTYAFLKKGVVSLKVHTKGNLKSSVVTLIPEDKKYEVLGETENWYKIALDDTKGYVAKKCVNTRVRFKKAISIKEEKEKIRRKKAAIKAEKERLAALEAARQAARSAASSSSSSSSSRSSSSSSRTTTRKTTTQRRRTTYTPPVTSNTSGSAIAAYAQKFVGNPYVYGGTSLTNGTDCSGFTQSIYRQFGYSIPRTAAAQSVGAGRAVSLSSLQPGDLLFYRNGSHVGHVALYIGGGRVVHASNPRDGIKISSYNYRKPCCARRIVG